MRLTLLLILLVNSIFAQSSFTLQEAVDYAITNSNDVRLAEIEVKDAKAKVTEYKAIGLPQINGYLKYQHFMQIPVSPTPDFLTPSVYQILVEEGVPGVEPYTGTPEVFQFTFQQRNNLNAGIEGSWLLFDGSYLSGLKAARLYKELTTKSLDIAEEQIRANVTKAYMNILISEENKKTLKDNLDNLDKILTETRAYYEEGLLESLDVSRIELSYENIKTEFEKLDQYIDISYNLLKFQMSYPLSDEIIITEDLDKLVDLFQIEAVDLDESIMFENRAQYDQILSTIELNEMNLQRLKRGYLPNLSARANYNQIMQRSDLFDSEEFGFIPQSSVSLSLNVPIFDGFMKKGQVQQAKITLEQLDIQKFEFERAMTLQVNNSRMQYINAKKTLENRRKSLTIVEDIYDKTSIKFKEGVGSSIELTQAESQLLDAQSNYINALYDLLISKTELDIALGKI